MYKLFIGSKYEQINQANPSITTFKGVTILRKLFLILATLRSQMNMIHNLLTLTPLDYYSTADLNLCSYPCPIGPKQLSRQSSEWAYVRVGTLVRRGTRIE
jgi:hypothetical protein